MDLHERNPRECSHQSLHPRENVLLRQKHRVIRNELVIPTPREKGGDRIRKKKWAALLVLGAQVVRLPAAAMAGAEEKPPPGLPMVPIPAHNSQSAARLALGIKLFEDKRFSSTGKVRCAECHLAEKTFTDNPEQVSEGSSGLAGTRDSPTVVNAAHMKTQFWDGRSPDLEGQGSIRL